MRKFLETIHEKPETHKKRFALLVSGGLTLLIFTIWSVATFESKEGQVVVRDNEIREFSPLESLKASVGAAMRVLRNDVDNIERGLEIVERYGPVRSNR